MYSTYILIISDKPKKNKQFTQKSNIYYLTYCKARTNKAWKEGNQIINPNQNMMRMIEPEEYVLFKKIINHFCYVLIVLASYKKI